MPHPVGEKTVGIPLGKIGGWFFDHPEALGGKPLLGFLAQGLAQILGIVRAPDERPTLVYPVTQKLINVFSGKIGNSVQAADDVLHLINNF